jgi:hypothetical protein
VLQNTRLTSFPPYEHEAEVQFVLTAQPIRLHDQQDRFQYVFSTSDTNQFQFIYRESHSVRIPFRYSSWRIINFVSLSFGRRSSASSFVFITFQASYIVRSWPDTLPLRITTTLITRPHRIVAILISATSEHSRSFIHYVYIKYTLRTFISHARRVVGNIFCYTLLTQCYIHLTTPLVLTETGDRSYSRCRSSDRNENLRLSPRNDRTRWVQVICQQIWVNCKIRNWHVIRREVFYFLIVGT